MTLVPGMRLSRDARTSYEIVERAWTGARHDYFLGLPSGIVPNPKFST